MLEIALALGVVNLILCVLIEWRMRRLERFLNTPLPRGVSTHGEVQLALAHNADYFKAKRDEFPKGSRQWILYDQRVKQMGG